MDSEGFYWLVPPRTGVVSTSTLSGVIWLPLRHRNPMPMVVLFPRLQRWQDRVSDAWSVLRGRSSLER